MEITTELLKTIYGRVNEFSIAKYDKECDELVILDDGSIAMRHCATYRYDDDEQVNVSIKDLSSDFDELAKERDKKRELDIIKEKARIEKNRIEREVLDRSRRKAQYEKLKKEFN